MKKKELLDKQLLAEIQPQGGITFSDEAYIRTGVGYEACIHVYDYPHKELPQLWLVQLMMMNDVVATIDIATENTLEVQKNINKSTREQRSRLYSATDISEIMDANRRHEELEELYAEVTDMGEITKLIHARLYVSAYTRADLDSKVKDVLSRLETYNYKAAIFLNESENEWRAMYQPYHIQQETESKRYGQIIAAGALAWGDPFHFASLEDPCGTFLGTTQTSGGKVMLDTFHLDNNRKSYTGLLVGNMGSGKSSTIKKIAQDRIVRGDFVRGFDPTGEYTPLVRHYGGKILSLDGTDGILNPLEILRTTLPNNEQLNFTRHISKLNAVYKFLAPSADQYELATLSNLLYDFYDELGLTPDKREEITGLPSAAYPIWEDFVSYLKRRIEENAVEQENNAVKRELLIEEAKRYNRICIILEDVIRNFGNILNGHTSIEDIMDEQVVFFNIQELSHVKQEIFDVQVFVALMLSWQNCIAVGSAMKEQYDHGLIDFRDITRFLVIIDEAHRIINTNKLHAVEQLLTYERESRKYFGGLLYATPSIREFVPSISDSKAVEKIMSLFELAQYKFIMQQDSNCLDLLRTTFQGQITESELTRIPKFGKGDCLLAISGDRNILFHVDLTEDEMRLFSGGA